MYYYLLMLNKIIDFSIKNKLIIGLFVLGLIIGGIYAAMKLPIDAVPDITNNRMIDMRKMLPDLVPAPRFGAGLHQ